MLESPLIKKRLQDKCFPVNIAKFLRKFFYKIPLVAPSELKSHISNASLDKNKKKLFLYFDNSHANQTNTTKKLWFFSYIFNMNKNLKKIDEKKYFKCIYQSFP